MEQMRNQLSFTNSNRNKNNNNDSTTKEQQQQQQQQQRQSSTSTSSSSSTSIGKRIQHQHQKSSSKTHDVGDTLGHLHPSPNNNLDTNTNKKRNHQNSKLLPTTNSIKSRNTDRISSESKVIVLDHDTNSCTSDNNNNKNKNDNKNGFVYKCLSSKSKSTKILHSSLFSNFPITTVRTGLVGIGGTTGSSNNGRRSSFEPSQRYEESLQTQKRLPLVQFDQSRNKKKIDSDSKKQQQKNRVIQSNRKNSISIQQQQLLQQQQHQSTAMVDFGYDDNEEIEDCGTSLFTVSTNNNYGGIQQSHKQYNHHHQQQQSIDTDDDNDIDSVKLVSQHQRQHQHQHPSPVMTTSTKPTVAAFNSQQILSNRFKRKKVRINETKKTPQIVLTKSTPDKESMFWNHKKELLSSSNTNSCNNNNKNSNINISSNSDNSNNNNNVIRKRPRSPQSINDEAENQTTTPLEYSEKVKKATAIENDSCTDKNISKQSRTLSESSTLTPTEQQNANNTVVQGRTNNSTIYMDVDAEDKNNCEYENIEDELDDIELGIMQRSSSSGSKSKHYKNNNKHTEDYKNKVNNNDNSTTATADTSTCSNMILASVPCASQKISATIRALGELRKGHDYNYNADFDDDFKFSDTYVPCRKPAMKKRNLGKQRQSNDDCNYNCNDNDNDVDAKDEMQNICRIEDDLDKIETSSNTEKGVVRTRVTNETLSNRKAPSVEQVPVKEKGDKQRKDSDENNVVRKINVSSNDSKTHQILYSSPIVNYNDKNMPIRQPPTSADTAIDLCQQDSPPIEKPIARIQTPLSTSSNALFGDKNWSGVTPRVVEKFFNSSGLDVLSIVNSISSTTYTGKNVANDEEDKTSIQDRNGDSKRRSLNCMGAKKTVQPLCKTTNDEQQVCLDRNAKSSWKQDDDDTKKMSNVFTFSKQNNPDSAKNQKDIGGVELTEHNSVSSDNSASVQRKIRGKFGAVRRSAPVPIEPGKSLLHLDRNSPKVKDKAELANNTAYDNSNTSTMISNKQPTINIEALRTSVGEHVYQADCCFDIHGQKIVEISYKENPSRSMPQCHLVSWPKDVVELMYYMNDLDSISTTKPHSGGMGSLLCLQILATIDNSFLKRSDTSNEAKESKIEVIIEFPDNECLCKILDTLVIMNDNELTREESKRYFQILENGVLTRNSKQQIDIRSPEKIKNINPFVAGKKDSDILLAYPFNGDKGEIEQCANRLKEAGYLTSGKVSTTLTTDTSDTKETSSRANSFVIRVVDYLSLEPGEWLNDTMIDFWLQWMTRNYFESNLHIFSSHFYTTLAKSDPSAVRSWTERKKIDIFRKKFVFIPINRSHHWSLCVLVNPGAIRTSNELDNISSTKPRLFPCFLFFDSLGLHKKLIIARKLREWLNAEWKRERNDESNPYTEYSMKIYTPKVPRQDNLLDCGVFVCQYSYLMFTMLRKGRVFKDNNQGCRDEMIQKIIDSNGFTFDMDDITELRTEFQLLVESLSMVYSSWKKDGTPNTATNSASRSNGSTSCSSQPEVTDKSHQQDDCRREIDFGAAATPATPPMRQKLRNEGGTKQNSLSVVKSGDEETSDKGLNTAALSPRRRLNEVSTSTNMSPRDKLSSSCRKKLDIDLENNQSTTTTTNDRIASIPTLHFSRELQNIVNPGNGSMIVHGMNVIDMESI